MPRRRIGATVTTRLDEDTLVTLDAQAEQQGVPRAELMRRYIEQSAARALDEATDAFEASLQVRTATHAIYRALVEVLAEVARVRPRSAVIAADTLGLQLRRFADVVAQDQLDTTVDALLDEQGLGDRDLP